MGLLHSSETVDYVFPENFGNGGMGYHGAIVSAADLGYIHRKLTKLGNYKDYNTPFPSQLPPLPPAMYTLGRNELVEVSVLIDHSGFLNGRRPPVHPVTAMAVPVIPTGENRDYWAQLVEMNVPLMPGENPDRSGQLQIDEEGYKHWLKIATFTGRMATELLLNTGQIALPAEN